MAGHVTAPMTTTVRAECFVPGNHLMAGLLGTRDEHLRQIEQAFPDEQIVVQGNRISVEGPAAELVVRLFDELILMLQAGQGPRRLDHGPHHRHGARGHPAERGAALRGRAGRRRQDRAAQHGGAEALHRRHRAEHHHLRHRAGRDRQVLPRRRPGRPRPAVAPGDADHPDPARPSRRASGSASCPAT